MNTENWLESQGAAVDIFIQDPNLKHDGFQLQTSFAYKDSMLNNYLQCYSGTLSADEHLNTHGFRFSPNPFSNQTTLYSDQILKSAALTLYNSLGQVKQTKRFSGNSITIYRDNLPNGCYYIRLTEENKIILQEKLLIVN